MDKNKIAVDLFDKLANAYQDKFMDVSLYADSFDIFCKTGKENAAVLELACGPGNITKYILQKRPDFRILGTDLSLNMICLAKINNPNAEFQLMDCRNIRTITKKYDALMCGFCLPYLSKEEAIQLIEDASKILTSEGIFYLSTMEDESSKSEFKKGSTGEEIFMHYHQADYLIEALKKNNFKIIDLQRKKYQNPDGSNTTDLLLLAGK